MARALVDGSEVPVEAFVLEGIVLSSYRPQGRKSKQCSFEITYDELTKVLKRPYDELLEDSRKDEAKTGDKDRLGEAGYPKFEVAIRDRDLLLDVFQGFLAIDYFGSYIRRPDAIKSVRYFIDRFAEAQCGIDYVVLKGMCLEY